MSENATTAGETRPKLRWIDRRPVRWAMELGFFALLLAGIFWFQTRSLVDTGSPAPTFAAATLDGGQLDLAELRGKPTVLFFWAPWCGVCEADAHNIEALREGVGDDANVISVALSYEDVSSVRDFARRNAIEAPVVLGDRSIAEAYAIDAFPTVYILDSDGRIASHAVGYTTEIGLRTRLFFAR